MSFKEIPASELQVAAKLVYKENQTFLKRLKKQTQHNKLDDTFHELHNQAFEAIDCLNCGNCCKTAGPRLSDKDIARLAKHTRMKVFDFQTQYVRVDEDGDQVFKGLPCPFLGDDNACTVYDERPLACREYPHTDRKRMYQILDETLKNTLVCPAVFQIVEKLKEVNK